MRNSRFIEKRSIDYVPLAERHGKVWHLWPVWFSGDAHLATVAWSNSNRAGLMFHQSHVMGIGLPPGLKFIWRLALEAKLKEVEGVIAMGVPTEQACGSVGFTEDNLHQMARQIGGDEKFERVLQHAKRLLNR